MLGSLIHGLPEILTEITFYRFTKELIYTHFILLALFEGITADVPSVEVECSCSIAQRRYADRIESA
jgi:hypothetical protein